MAYSTRPKLKISRTLNASTIGDPPIRCVIDALPPEILGEVFCLTAAPAFRVDGKEMEIDVMYLLLVCKAWRAVALQTPRLWSNLTLRIGNPGTNYEELVKRFSRAKGISKSVFVLLKRRGPWGCLCETGIIGCDFSDPTLAKLLERGPLLDRFQINLDSANCLWNFSRATSSLNDGQGLRAWDSLTSLTLKVPAGRGLVPSLKRLLEPLKLRAFHLYILTPDHPSQNPLPSDLGIPTKVLRALKEVTFSCNCDHLQVVAFLQHCVNASVVAIESGINRIRTVDRLVLSPTISQSTPLTLPNVQNLVVNIRRPSACANLLPLLDFPNASDLRIRLPRWNHRFDMKYIQDILCAFRPLEPFSLSSTLRSLTLYTPSSSPHFDAQCLFDILAGLPSLASLALENVKVHMRRFANIHRKFREQPGSPKILPELVSLEFVLPGGPSFDLEAVFGFVKSRRRHIVYAGHVEIQEPDSLRKLTFRHWYDPEGELDAEYRTSPSVQQLRDFFGVAVEKI